MAMGARQKATFWPVGSSTLTWKSYWPVARSVSGILKRIGIAFDQCCAVGGVDGGGAQQLADRDVVERLGGVRGTVRGPERCFHRK